MAMNIHHIGIKVRDYDAMLSFYQDAFGFKVLGTELDIAKDKAAEISGSNRAKSTARVIMMQTGNCYLEIMENPNLPDTAGSEPQRGYTQICIDVDDIDAEYARLKDLGMVWRSGAPVDFGHVKAVTGCDPEGNAFELVQTMRDWDCNLAELLPLRA